MGPDTGYCSSVPQITFCFIHVSVPYVITKFVTPVRSKPRKHYCWTRLLAFFQTKYTRLLHFKFVSCNSGFLRYLVVTCLCILILLFLFLDIFNDFFCKTPLIFITLVFLLSFCWCFLFQLKIFSKLVYSLLSSVLGRATHMDLSSLVVEHILALLDSMPHAARSLCLFSFYLGFPQNKLVAWRMWFGFLRSAFRLTVRLTSTHDPVSKKKSILLREDLRWIAQVKWWQLWVEWV